MNPNMNPNPYCLAIAQGRYIGRVIDVVAVQNEHGYSVAYRIRYQREIEPNTGWFLAHDVRALRPGASLAWAVEPSVLSIGAL